MFKFIDIGIIVLSSGMFLLLYVLFLRKEKYHQLNRFCLLFSLAFSSLLPFIRFRMPAKQMITTISDNLTIVSEASTIHVGSILYFAGAALFFILFLLKMVKVLRHVLGKPFTEMNGLKVINQPQQKSPFSFFRYVVVDFAAFEAKELDLVLRHEAAHAWQRHTMDLLFVEVMGVVCWFNPFVWTYKSALKSVHEFAADEAVIRSNVLSDDYLDLILKQIRHQNRIAPVHSFSAASIKSRVRMMMEMRKGRHRWMRYLSVIPMVALLVVGNSLLASETSIPSAIEHFIMPEIVLEQPSMPSVDEVSIANHKKAKKTPRRMESRPKFEESVSELDVLESQSWLSTQYGDPVEFYEEKPASKQEVHYTVKVVCEDPQIYQVTTPRNAGFASTRGSDEPKVYAYPITTPDNP